MSLPHAILGVLATGPRHGHAVARALAHLLDGIRPVNPGQVYATLGRLTRRQLLSAALHDEPDTQRSRVRPFVILPEGRRVLRRWLERAAAEPQARCGFVERLVVLTALGDAGGIERLVAARRARLATLRDTLARLDRSRRARDATAVDGALAALVREAVLRLLAAELDWLSNAERTLLPGRPAVTGRMKCARRLTPRA